MAKTLQGVLPLVHCMKIPIFLFGLFSCTWHWPRSWCKLYIVNMIHCLLHWHTCEMAWSPFTQMSFIVLGAYYQSMLALHVEGLHIVATWLKVFQLPVLKQYWLWGAHSPCEVHGVGVLALRVSMLLCSGFTSFIVLHNALHQASFSSGWMGTFQ